MIKSIFYISIILLFLFMLFTPFFVNLPLVSFLIVQIIIFMVLLMQFFHHRKRIDKDAKKQYIVRYFSVVIVFVIVNFASYFLVKSESVELNQGLAVLFLALTVPLLTTLIKQIFS